MDRRQNIMLFKKIINNMIYNTAKIEKVNATFPQTETIVNGMSVSGLSTDDVQIILNLKNAAKYIIESINEPFSLKTLLEINKRVAYNESIEWGVLRTGTVSVGGTNFQPELPKKENIEEVIEESGFSTEKDVVKFMYKMIKKQIFWDGNKRTQILAANFILINNALGCLMIREELLEKWNNLLHNYYEYNDIEPLVEWTIKNCIVKII